MWSAARRTSMPPLTTRVGSARAALPAWRHAPARRVPRRFPLPSPLWCREALAQDACCAMNIGLWIVAVLLLLAAAGAAWWQRRHRSRSDDPVARPAAAPAAEPVGEAPAPVGAVRDEWSER